MVNITVPFIVSIVTIVVLACIFCWYVKKLSTETFNGSLGRLVVFLGLVMSMITVALAMVSGHPGLWLFLQPGTLVFSQEGRLLTQVDQEQALWRWSPEARGDYVIQMNTYHRASYGISVQPITPNPKVRELYYEVAVTINNDPDMFGKFIAHFGEPALASSIPGIVSGKILESDPARDHVRSLLYEFNELHSEDLAGFYNPLSDEQQEKFVNLVSPYIEGKLADVGLKIESIRFSLP